MDEEDDLFSVSFGGAIAFGRVKELVYRVAVKCRPLKEVVRTEFIKPLAEAQRKCVETDTRIP